MKITRIFKYIAAVPPVASVSLCYLAWQYFKTKFLIAMHNILETDKKIPERLAVMQESVEKNANLMLACSVVVMLSWFAFAPDSIPNIYTNVIGTWTYTAIDLIVNLRKHEV